MMTSSAVESVDTDVKYFIKHEGNSYRHSVVRIEEGKYKYGKIMVTINIDRIFHTTGEMVSVEWIEPIFVTSQQF